MNAPTTVDELLDLFERLGGDYYGEDVSQLDHALQCAALARRDGADDELVCAALLHDIGHLVVDRGSEAGWRDDVDDDHHEAVGARILAALFGPSVAAPVALHVTAKRWRCTVDPAYRASLSATSRATLVAQGGPLDEAACKRFEAHPASAHAVALRGWDDEGKDPDVSPGRLSDYEPLLRALAARAATAAGRAGT